MDFNKDGVNDILTVGNHYGVEVETTRYDAGIGNLFLGDAQNGYRSLSASESGLYVPFDSRDIKIIEQNGKSLVIITNNNAAISVFSIFN